MSLGAWVTYITPSTTSGVAEKLCSDWAWKIHFCSRVVTFEGVTSFSWV